MKAIILNGTNPDDGELLSSVQGTLTGMLEEQGWQVRPFTLHQMNIAHCQGCFGCWVQTPGQCVLKRGGDEIAEAFIQSDLVLLLTPVTFGGYSAELKKAVDHLIPNILPYFRSVDGETHHVPRYRRYPRLGAVGALEQRDAESEAIFGRLVKCNAINMDAPAHAVEFVTEQDSVDPTRQRLQSLLAGLLAEVEVNS